EGAFRHGVSEPPRAAARNGLIIRADGGCDFNAMCYGAHALKKSAEPFMRSESSHAGSRSRGCKVSCRSCAGGAGVLLERLAPARLGNEKSPGTRVQSDERTHGD